MINYPKKLEQIFYKLAKYDAIPIIVGGFVRDSLLKIQSKDIDIEVYGISSFEELESILYEFGDVNSVGKSFGVCKLNFDGLDLDFSLPRKDSKIAQGHKGFEVEIDSNLDFKTATSRRDFTINAIGYDTIKNIIIDPFNGVKDLNKKILRVVDSEKFSQDPLRVLRAIQFYARFNLRFDSKLFTLCEDMVNNNLLDELPKDRIFGEIKKLILKSSNPSTGFKLLKSLNGLKYMKPLGSLTNNQFEKAMILVDIIAKERIESKNIKIILILAIICYRFDSIQTNEFITNLTNDKNILKEVLILNKSDFKNIYTDSELYKLATKINIELFLIYQKVIHNNLNNELFYELKERAKELKILNKKAIPLIQGRDILKLGIKPSKEYSKILNSAYEAQLNLIIINKEESERWLKNFLSL